MNSRWTSLVVLICFFLSGVAGLVYQVVWSRYLALFLGHTSYAIVAVLVAFMGGLAIGNAWLGGYADKIRRPLAFYAWLEIIIGVYALVFPYYNEWVHAAYIAVARSFTPGSTALLIVKFGFSLLTILLPTVLMGATFPALVRFVTHSLGELREKVALLYFLNSAGAVAGCALAGFWWIPEIGLHATVYASAALNLAVGAAAIFISARIGEGQVASRLPAASEPSAPEQYTGRELRLAVFGIGLSGFVAMLYEVAWTRLLALALGSSTHAFTLMLITFITGIAVGAWLVSRWRNLKDSLMAFAWAELALAGSVLASMFLYERLPYWFVYLGNIIARRPDTYYLWHFIQMFICFVVMFIPTVCLGMTLPLVSRIATAQLSNSGKSVGSVFAINTLGTVLGAAITGLLILPNLGLARTFGLGLALNAFIGASILAVRRGIGLGKVVGSTVVGGAILVLLTGALFNEKWQKIFSIGLFRETQAYKLDDYYRYTSIQYYKDGPGSSVTVYKIEAPSLTNTILKVNGKTEASTTGDVPTQLLISHIPLILRPGSSNVLVVGLGSGMTSAAALRHNTVQRVDTIEISRQMAEGAEYFKEHTDDVLRNPRMRLIIEDAKSFLQTGGDKYDVIVSEPSNPWMAGVAGVFTQEYYKQCRARLATNGLMIQWVQQYETSDAAMQTVLATFSSVFPHVSVWQGHLSDLILVGSTTEPNFSLTASEAEFNKPAVKSSMARFGLTEFPLFLTHQLVSFDNGGFTSVDGTQIHTDTFPILEYQAQRGFFAGQNSTYIYRFGEQGLTRNHLLINDWLKANRLDERLYKQFSSYWMAHRFPDERVMESLMYRWARENPSTTQPLELLTLGKQGRSRWEHEAEAWRDRKPEFIRLAAQDPHMLRLYTLSLLRAYRLQRTMFYVPDQKDLVECLERLIETDADMVRLYTLHLAELAWDRGDDDACLKLGAEALDPRGLREAKVRFEFDPVAPYITVANILETYLERRDLRSLTQFYLTAELGGWFNENPVKPPRVDLIARKVRAIDMETFGSPQELPRL